MDSALRVADVGVEGVYAAIADGMKAGQYAHENEVLRARIEALEAENAGLKRVNRDLTKQLNSERRVNRAYRVSRQSAYRWVLARQAEETKEGRALRCILSFSAGMFLIMVVTLVIIIAG